MKRVASHESVCAQEKIGFDVLKCRWHWQTYAQANWVWEVDVTLVLIIGVPEQGPKKPL